VQLIISGHRQKKKEDVLQHIATRVASDNIYASIGRLGMTQVTGRGTDKIPAGGSGKPQNYRSKIIRPKAEQTSLGNLKEPGHSSYHACNVQSSMPRHSWLQQL
jgi:hypothetical protein